jgi:hypothetical protein
MEKDLGRIKKNADMDIIVRVDDFGGKPGLTIREYVNKSESGYTGFTKSGTRIPAESFEAFKQMINSVDPKDFATEGQAALPENTPTQNNSTDDVPEEDLM